LTELQEQQQAEIEPDGTDGPIPICDLCGRPADPEAPDVWVQGDAPYHWSIVHRRCAEHPDEE